MERLNRIDPRRTATEDLIFELSRPGAATYRVVDEPLEAPDDPRVLFEDCPLRDGIDHFPEVSEIEVVRHFTRLSQLNFSIDTQTYPLGSCTMKYNPRINEALGSLPGLAALHPLAPAPFDAGALEIMERLEDALCEISGLAAASLQPAAGAQGELTGMLMIRAYHVARGAARRTVLVPTSAHGTNPASCTLAGYESVAIEASGKTLALEDVRAHLSEDVAALMITNPNTLGLFERKIGEIIEAVHDVGALVYLDGANLNALLGHTRPGDWGVDVMHFNLHKTFSTPHGGGGPGSGPVAVADRLVPYLPLPRLARDGGPRRLTWDHPSSIGKVTTYYGNFGMFIRALAYILMNGAEGLRQVSEAAVLNANYLQESLRDLYHLPNPGRCMHETVLTDANQQAYGVRTLDVAKRLLDYGLHPPTIYFPLIVEGALMIEPTETEARHRLDQLIDALRSIAEEARTDPELLREAPHTTPVRRLDEARAARKPILRWTPEVGAP